MRGRLPQVSARRVSRQSLRVVVVLACVGAVLAGVAVDALSTSLQRGTRSPAAQLASKARRKTGPTTASNKRAAVRDAKRLLAGVAPPAGAVLRSSGTGIGARAHLLTLALASATAHSTWTVPGDPASVLSSVIAHLPAGSTSISTGSSGPTPFTQFVTQSWPPVRGVLDVRWLELDVTARHGGTFLHAESQSQWIVTRPTQEEIPPGVREIDVMRSWPGKPPLTIRRVTGRANVHALVALFDSLGIVQPGVMSCPGETLGPNVVVAFYAGGARLVARAAVSAAADANWPNGVPGWACYPITFAVLGHTWPPLAGSVILPMQRLLHVKLG